MSNFGGLFSSELVSPELISLTHAFIEEGIPISHGVVPVEVNKETVMWLLEMKSMYPRLIGIDQHGYAHVKHESGEFGGEGATKNKRRKLQPAWS